MDKTDQDERWLCTADPLLGVDKRWRCRIVGKWTENDIRTENDVRTENDALAAHKIFLLVCLVLQVLRERERLKPFYREILRHIPISLIMRSTLQRTFPPPPPHYSNCFLVFSSVELLVCGVYYVKPNYNKWPPSCSEAPLFLFRVLRVQL